MSTAINGRYIYSPRAFLKLCVLAGVFILPNLALSAPARVGDILIKGNKIVESAAIRSKIKSRVNKAYSAKTVRRDVQRIFNTGWFYDIEVRKNKGAKGKVVLTYIVKEKPIVEKIIYEGNSALSKKELDELFRFSPYEFLNHKKIRSAIKSIRDEYEKKGYYLVEISHSIKKTSHLKKVHLIINIKENKKVTVKRVRFIGNHSLSSREIKSFMGTREKNLLSFISSAGSYSRDALEQDLNNIRFIYMDRGYWKVFVGQPDLLISPDKTDMTITIPIKEGEQYRAGTLGFTGDLIFDELTLKEEMETEEGEVFSYGKLQRDINRLETKYGDEGYAFVNIIPRFYSMPGDDKNTIHLMFEIQKGKKVRIGMIHIGGNTYTRDKVIRREIRIFEGALYSETDKKRSLENIQRLGFFDDVKIIPKTIKNRDDLVDMEVIIKERENTGTLELGAGYDGYNSVSLNAKVHKFNLFGKGYNVGLDSNLSIRRQYINLNFSDPYFLDSRWYFGWDFYLDYWNPQNFETDYLAVCDKVDKKQAEHTAKVASNQFKSEEERKQSEKALQALNSACLSAFPEISYRGFSEQKISGGFTFGRPITDTLKLLFYYRMEHLSFFNTIDKDLYPTERAGGLRNPVEAIVEYDKRNDRVAPTAGMYARGSMTYDGFFGKFNYLTFSSNVRFYQSLFWDLVFRVNIQYSQHLNLSGEDGGVPFDQLFLLGGIHSLRGFKYFAVGPRKRSEVIYQKAKKYGHPEPERAASRVFGGTKEFFTNIELQIPVFPSMRLSAVLFVDMGTAYNNLSSADLRGNWGFGLRFFSPMGPIRLEMGLPFEPRKQWGEESSEFQFTMGLPF